MIGKALLLEDWAVGDVSGRSSIEAASIVMGTNRRCRSLAKARENCGFAVPSTETSYELFSALETATTLRCNQT